MRNPGLLLLMILLAPPAMAQEVKVTLEPEVIGLDEMATLTIEVHGDGFSAMSFRPKFELDNLEVVGRPSRFDDIRFTNGNLSRTFRTSWQVRPLALGKARVRAIVVGLDDTEVRVPAQELRVQQEPTSQEAQRRPRAPDEEGDPFQRLFGRMPNPWREEPRQPEVFLRAELQPARPVAGQQVLYTIYLYTREDIAGISPSGMPAFRGFWVRDIPLPQQLPTDMVDIDGRRYGRVPLLKKALFPLRAGSYKVEPATVDLLVQRYDRSFFSFRPTLAHPEQIRLRTAAQTIEVRPLPPAPPGFGGAVGELALAAELEPREIHLGEAATLTVRLSGVGNLQGIREPRVQPPPGLTLLPPQQEGKEELNGSAVRGTRIWRYAVVPDRAGRFTLDAPKITYFDPAEARYQVATTTDLALTALAPPPSAARLAAPARPGGAAAGTTGSMAAGRTGLGGRRWSPVLPWLIALPWGLVLVAALVRGRTARTLLKEDEEVRRFTAILREAEAEERPRQMALRLEEAWRDLLARRWGISPATPPSRWRELLAGQGVEAEALDELDLLIEDLRYLRSAPQLSTTDALRGDAISRSRRLLRRLGQGAPAASAAVEP